MGKRLLRLDRGLDVTDMDIEQPTTNTNNNNTATIVFTNTMNDVVDDTNVVGTDEKDIQALIDASASSSGSRLGLGIGSRVMSETTFDASAHELLRMQDVSLVTPNGNVL